MTRNELDILLAQRELAFGALPHGALRVVSEALAKLDFARATRAVAAYGQAKPYRGFWLAKFNEFYAREAPEPSTPRPTTRESERARMDRPLDAPTTANHDEDLHLARTVAEDMARDIRDYEALSHDVVLAAREKFGSWGWREGTRAWRTIVLDWVAGRPVDQYRIHAGIGSRERQREEKIAALAAQQTDERWRHRVGILRGEIARCGGNVDIIA